MNTPSEIFLVNRLAQGDKAGRFNETRRYEEIGCRRVSLDIVAQGSHEPSHGIAKGRILLNDRYQ
jgi:hypothetical protein